MVLGIDPCNLINRANFGAVSGVRH
jgi:hypothetical protein